ncbi:MAG: hypothetical protein ABSH21_12535 [Verrucomicrobiia bacterium]
MDGLYPALSKLAEETKGKTLCSLGMSALTGNYGKVSQCGQSFGECAHQKKKGNEVLCDKPRASCDWQKDTSFLRFVDCCYMVQKDFSDCWPHYYLATVNEFVSKISDRAVRKRVWHKLRGSGSQFLDTVVEAAWALHFWDKKIDFKLDEQFDRSNPQSGDADFCVHHKGGSYWLEATNVDLIKHDVPIVKPSDPSAEQPKTKRTTISILVERAERKFREKFAVNPEPTSLKGASAGILLSIQSSLRAVMSPLSTAPEKILAGDQSPLVADMFKKFANNNPALSLVLIHWLGDFAASGTLRPGYFVAWQPSGDDQFGWLLKTLPRLNRDFQVESSGSI